MEKFEEKARCNAKNVTILWEKKQTNKQKKKQKQKLTENNQIAACIIVVSVKNTQPRSHSSLREMRDRVTQYAIKLHA